MQRFPHRRSTWRLSVAIGLLTLVMAFVIPGVTRAASATLTLTPSQFPCGTVPPPVEARGAGLPPGPIVLILARTGSLKGVEVGRATVAADGTVALPLALRGAIACGNQYTIDVEAVTATGQFGPPVLASATLTVSDTAAPRLPNTGGGWEQPTTTDVAWAAARAKIPPKVPVYRPTYLPARFQQQAPALVNYVGVPAVVYQRADSQLAFVFGQANSAEATGSEAVTVHGMQGHLVFSAGYSAIQVTWTEAGAMYSVRGTKDVTRDELLRVVASLVPVGPDGSVVPALPNTGAGGAWRAVSRAGLFGLGSFLVVVGAFALLASRRSSGRPARPGRAALAGHGPSGGWGASTRN